MHASVELVAEFQFGSMQFPFVAAMARSRVVSYGNIMAAQQHLGIN